MATTEPDSKDGSAPQHNGVIRLHLRESRQLFDAMDPSPFWEKDLDKNAELYIVDSIDEMPSRTAGVILIHLDGPADDPEEERILGDAIHTHFERQALQLRRELHRLIRRGLMSLAIGLAFMAALIVVARNVNRVLGESTTAALIKECLLIGGWVAMWRPLEIFLYDWWPIRARWKLYRRLSAMTAKVKVAE